MQILWFNWRCWHNPQAGGAETHVKEIATRWVKLGHDVTLFCGKYEGCRERERLDGIEVIRKGSPYTVYLYAANEYLRHLKKRTYDLIIDDINGVPFFTPLYVRRPKIAILHHLVGDIFFKEISFEKAILGYAAERSVPLVYHDTPFATVSNSTKEELMRLGIAKSRIRVVHNGIDHNLFKPNPLNKSPYPHVIYFGRIKQYKNIDHVLKAFTILVNRLRNEERKRIKLTIAGRGEYEELRKLARGLGISDNTEFVEETSDSEKVSLLQNARLYVTASMREGWGLTAMEAMACGTPVVGYNVPGLRDSVVDGKTGFLVRYGDIQRLADAMSRVLYATTLENRFSKNAHEWALNFTWDRTAEEFLEFVEACL